MNARDDLATWLNAGLQEWGHDGREGDITAEGLIDAYAHELAEKIRREGAAWGKLSAAGKVYRAAADLIDPNGTPVEEAPRDDLWDQLGIDPDRISREEFDEYMDAYDQARPGEEPTT